MVREIVRMQDMLLWFYRQECQQSSRGMQACRGVENNVQTIKLTNHMSTEVRPLLFLSSCHEAPVKLVAERQFGRDWACLPFAPREVC